MSRLTEVKEIYAKITGIVTSSKKEWKDFLDFAARIYKYNFDNVVLIYAQRPDAAMVASMEIWNKRIGRYVNRGTRSIAVFDTSVSNIKLKYLFDIKDTNGEPHTIPKLWKLNDEITPGLIYNINEKYSLEANTIENLISQITDIKVNENFDNILIDFEDDIKNTWLEDLPTEGFLSYFAQTITESVNYMVARRCGIQSLIFTEENSFMVINHFNTRPLTIRLGNSVNTISQEILREFEGEVIKIIKEKRSEKNNEGENRTQLQRNRREILSGDTNIKGQRSRPEVLGEIRTDDIKLSERKSSEQIQLTSSHRETDAKNAASERRSLQEVGNNNGTDAKDRSNTKSGEQHGELQSQGENKRNGGGNSSPRDSVQTKINKLNQVDIFESQQSDSFFVPEINKKADPINYKYNPEDEIGVGGLKTKFKNNIEAIKTLKVIEEEKRFATFDEQKILAKYVGWGGIAEAFDSNASGWNNEYAELKAILTQEEYVSARASTPNAHYTSPIVIEGIYKALDSFGFKTGNILEPAVGVGNFFSILPNGMQSSKLYGVELDDISGRIAKQLYQKSEIKIQGFEENNYPDNFFDVAIGNVPFGDYKLHDPKYDKNNFLIHDYFFAKALDKVRPGGIIAFITSKGTMDKENNTVRKYIAERADLIGAIRLPNTAFKANANTDVTADIIFLQKRERVQVSEANWLHVSKTSDGVPINEYFLDNPEMLLGKMVFDQRMFGEGSRYTALVNNEENFDLSEALNKAVQNLSANISSFEREVEGEQENIISADPNVRNYTYTFINDELYYRENAVMRKIEATGKNLERIKGLHSIREITREIIDIQTKGCSEVELKEKQEVLNKSYDGFVKNHGYITSRTNNTAFRDDNDYPLLCSLEVIDKDRNVTKADMFTKQTIRPLEKITEVDTASEALTVSLNEKGVVDLSLMLELYNSTPENIIKELKGQIFFKP